MSPTPRRRRADPTLNDALGEVGTKVTEASDHVPDEPAWLRDAATVSATAPSQAGGPGLDPAAMAPPLTPDPAAIARRREERHQAHTRQHAGRHFVRPRRASFTWLAEECYAINFHEGRRRERTGQRQHGGRDGQDGAKYAALELRGLQGSLEGEPLRDKPVERRQG